MEVKKKMEKKYPINLKIESMSFLSRVLEFYISQSRDALQIKRAVDNQRYIEERINEIAQGRE